MIIHCTENKFTDPSVKYTLEFILDSLGIFYAWTMGNPSDIILNYLPPETTTNKAGIQLPQVFILKNLHKEKLSWENFNLGDISVPVLGLQKNVPENTIPFDIIATVYFHLARIEEIDFKHPDDVDKNVEKMLLYSETKFKAAVVDHIVNWFGVYIENIFRGSKSCFIKKSLYPENKQYGIAITHDVDFVTALNPLKYKLLALLSEIGLKKEAFNYWRQKNQKTWAFDKLLSFYDTKNWKATFNFIPRMNEGFHNRYSIKSKKLKHLFEKLINSGHEIGLHPSRYAFEHPGRYKREMHKLEKAAGIKPSGLRHHYLRTLFPFIWKVTDALGLSYDSTMAFRRHAGFRAGTSHPFRGFDHLQQYLFKCVEFPTAFFEQSLPELGNNTEKAKEVISSLREEAKNQKGVFTVLWHTDNIYTSEHSEELWNFITAAIDDNDAFIAPLENHLKWYHLKNNLFIDDYKREGNYLKIRLAKPAGLDSFSLTVADRIKTAIVDSGKCTLNKNEIHINTVPESQKINMEIELTDA